VYFKAPHAILAYSSAAARTVAALGVPPERVVVCHNGLDVSDVLTHGDAIRDAAAATRREEQLGTEIVFLYVGRLTAGKKVDVLIDAFAELDMAYDCVLWIVGDGPDLGPLQERASRLQNRTIRFWGRKLDGVEKYFAAADCVVLPGSGGLALNQAMALGVPCICGMADGTADDLVMDDVTGWRFGNDDPGSLKAAMERAIEARRAGSLSKIGEAARDHLLATSTVDRMVDTFRSVVEGVLVPSSRPRCK
jgi:glycosyltransferase involved in cell wall biosynthesis